MDDGGLFLRDVVMPGGKRCTRTVVSRTLVGEPGSTYRYLGLRLFSHPWRDVDDAGDATTTTTTSTGAGGGGGGHCAIWDIPPVSLPPYCRWGMRMHP